MPLVKNYMSCCEDQMMSNGSIKRLFSILVLLQHQVFCVGIAIWVSPMAMEEAFLQPIEKCWFSNAWFDGVSFCWSLAVFCYNAHRLLNCVPICFRMYAQPSVFLIGFPGLIGLVCWWHDCHHLLMMYPIYFLRYDSEIEFRFMSGTTRHRYSNDIFHHFLSYFLDVTHIFPYGCVWK